MTAHIDSLVAVVDSQPDNHGVRLLLAELLVEAARPVEAAEHYVLLHAAGQLTSTNQAVAAAVALDAGLVDIARVLLADAVSPEPVADPDPVDDELRRLLGEAAIPEREAVRDGPPEVVGADFIDTEPMLATFDDVGGLHDVKKAVRRLIIQPIAKPELFAKYGKSAGGGVLLYGPPGCGKTLVAQATAGEAGLPFYNLRIEDIVDPYFGVSEQRLAGAFEAARELRPCVLFIDELDALGFARSQQRSERARSLVEILLQQLDSAGSDNEGLLVLAASNEPWDIDGALLRPGRFDRTIFVPPPDDDARRAILTRRLAKVPTDGVDVGRLVKSTALFSGADLGELVDRAIGEVIEEALASGLEPPLIQRHLDEALLETRGTTQPWLHRARNHADFGNLGGRWDDVGSFLKQRSVAKHLRQNEVGR